MDQGLSLWAMPAQRLAAELKTVAGKRIKTLKRKPSTAPMSMTVIAISIIIAKGLP
jgi:hypothetical protein